MIALGLAATASAQTSAPEGNETPPADAPAEGTPPAEATAPAATQQPSEPPAAQSSSATGEVTQASAEPATEELPPALRRPAAFSWEEDTTRSAPPEPLRILVQVGAGSSIRLVENNDFSQKRFAPSYLDLTAGVILPGAGVWRHGVALGLTTNITGDGSAAEGFDGFQQWALSPTYVAYFRLSNDIVVLGKGAVPFVLGPDFAVGLEAAGTFNFLLTAGLGLYAEGAASMYFGGGGSVHPILSIEGGVTVDYEVLP